MATHSLKESKKEMGNKPEINGDTAKEVSPIDDAESPHHIHQPKKDASESEAHNVRASRGEELGFHQTPQLPAK